MFKSRHLKFPKNPMIRPATDRNKETIFNILGQSLDGLEVLDLYAGMGSLGIESLSRGAFRATFVEQSALGVRYIQENIRALGLDNRAEVLKADVLRSVPDLFRRGRRFDVAFIDPPYNKGLVKKTLLLVAQFDILSPHGKIVVEHARQEELPCLGQYRLDRTNRYGITCLSFLYKTA
ncbi:MAG: 16S rRNA (guanine(966)-N(2))-methyltransferase RsmD [Candidatus Omnitrophica bacterium]|nr:16S rRNA (guanine(966)-N(2))-methyltransferase RsmD [Candidatus Omnitrophota bacterium]